MYELLRSIGYVVINPLYQVGFLFFVIVLLAYLRSKHLKWVLGLFVVHVFFFASLLGMFVTIRTLEEAYDLPRNAEPLDAVVVLTGGTVQFDPVNSLYQWHPSTHRFMEALRLFKATNSKFFVISGDTPGYSGPQLGEAESMARLAKEFGVPEEKIVFERKSQNTEQHPIELRPIFFEKNISSFYLVTSAYHMTRAAKVFEKQGFHPVPFPVGKIYPYANGFFSHDYYYSQRLAINEWVGLLIYKLKDLI